MALLTNNVREWEPLWRSMLPVDEIFELVVDSAFVGMRKPDPPIYELTLERLGGGSTPSDCLFVDDVARQRRGRARRSACAAVHFRANEQAIAEIRAALGLERLRRRQRARYGRPVKRDRRRRGGVQAGSPADHVRGDRRAARDRDPHRPARPRHPAAARARARRPAADLALDPAPGADHPGPDRAT